jgi:uncharacterized protein (TIGR03084 family)
VRILSDLRDENAALDELVADLPASRWTDPTPADGWTIAHQIGHLLWTDQASLMAITDPDAFTAQLTAAAANPTGFVDAGAAEHAARPSAELLADWRATRERLAEALASVPPGGKILWYGPPMKAASMATARLMETWAHGQDVADALGVTRKPTARLHSIAHLGVRTRDFAYALHQLDPPTEEFRVELTAPDGVEDDSVWVWGPEDVTQSVTGPAEDFCLLVTQRAHRADLALTATGPDSDAWLDIAQAFAGDPGTGRTVRRRRRGGSYLD